MKPTTENTFDSLVRPLDPSRQERIMELTMKKIKQEKTKRPRHPLRVVAATAAAAAILSLTAAATLHMDFAASIRSFWGLGDQKIPGNIMYSVEAEEVDTSDQAAVERQEITASPVSCTVGLCTIDVYYTFGPISQEEAREYGWQREDSNGLPQKCFQARCDGFLCESSNDFIGEENYDPSTGMVLGRAYFPYYEEESLPDQLHFEIYSVENLENDAEHMEGEPFASFTVEPEPPLVKTAELNLPVTLPDGAEGTVVRLQVDTGCYVWTEDIPTVREQLKDAETEEERAQLIQETKLDRKITDFGNAFLDAYFKDAWLNFADGSTKQIGSGDPLCFGPEYVKEWQGLGIVDIENLVSVTINGTEYPFT